MGAAGPTRVCRPNSIHTTDSCPVAKAGTRDSLDAAGHDRVAMHMSAGTANSCCTCNALRSGKATTHVDDPLDNHTCGCAAGQATAAHVPGVRQEAQYSQQPRRTAGPTDKGKYCIHSMISTPSSMPQSKPRKTRHKYFCAATVVSQHGQVLHLPQADATATAANGGFSDPRAPQVPRLYSTCSLQPRSTAKTSTKNQPQSASPEACQHTAATPVPSRTYAHHAR